MSNKKKYILSIVTILSVLLLDQVIKFVVKLHMFSGEEIIVIPNFFKIHFTENPGMAFGMELGGSNGKMFLSIFRLFAISGIAYFLWNGIKNNYHPGLIFCISLIFAGAVGNMIDCAFYGMIFNESYHELATLFPAEGGYSSFLKGNVVDMLYFPIINNAHFPKWIPLIGGSEFSFFNAIFNIADSSITVGVAIILIFQRSFFPQEEEIIHELKEEVEDVIVGTENIDRDIEMTQWDNEYEEDSPKI